MMLAIVLVGLGMSLMVSANMLLDIPGMPSWKLLAGTGLFATGIFIVVEAIRPYLGS